MRVVLPIVLGAAALATLFPAWFPGDPDRGGGAAVEDRYFGIEVEDFDEVVGLFDRVQKIEVTTWDQELSTAEHLVVERRAGDAWVIASRYDYPADGDDMVGKTVSQVVGVERLRKVADSASAHRELGVVDPRDEESPVFEGRGTRVAVTGEDGKVLVDLIIGEPVEDPMLRGQYYVREAGSDAVYTAQLVRRAVDDPDREALSELDTLAVSSRFIDWVEPDPFAIEAPDVRRVLIEDYSVDEQTGAVNIRSKTLFSRSDADDDWSTASPPPGKVVDDGELDSVVRKAGSLRLADVSQRVGLGDLEMQARGFYKGRLPNGGETLYGNEGVLHLTDKQGIGYHLFFGEVVGTETGARPGEDAGADGGSDRYMAVFASYDPSADEEVPVIPEPPAAPEGDQTAADDPAAADDQASTDDPGQDDEPAITEEDRQAHIAQREQRVAELNERFQRFFYVIRDADFEQLRPGLDSLFKDAEPEPDPAK